MTPLGSFMMYVMCVCILVVYGPAAITVFSELWWRWYNKDRTLPEMGYKALELPYVSRIDTSHVPESDE